MNYNAQTNQYTDDDGNIVELAALLLLIERLTNATKRQAKLLASKLADGAITLEQWQASMISLLKSAHIAAAATGRGGLDRLTADDWGRIEKKVTWQASYLPRFGAAIVAGAVIGAVLLRRAGSYGDPAYISFQSAFKEATISDGDEWYVENELNANESCEDCVALADLGFVPVDEMPEIGEDRACGNFCKCTFNFKRKSEL